MIQSVRLDLEICCDSCMEATAKIKVRVPWCELGSLLERGKPLEDTQLPDLWEYHSSGGWGMTGYTKTQLLCPRCVRTWRKESALDQMARKTFEKRPK
jgi:hypothetical protein